MLQYFSEGKTAQHAKYSPEDFLFRWKKLERVLEKQSLDGLLIITGMDGAEHPHTSYLFNWLFLGLSGTALYTNRYLDPIYSEMIILIGTKHNHIFLTPSARKQLQHLIYTLQNCEVFCPTETEYNNKDELDIQKITFFYQTTNRTHKLGFFLDNQQDTKIIEKWPIIQSYALEPVGRTFFTLKYQTTNLFSKITPLFKNFDKHSLRNLLTQTAYAVEGQIGGSLQCIEYTKDTERQQISELKLQQPLFEAVDIGNLQISNQNKQNSVRVLFSYRTGGGTELNSSQATIQSTRAFHLTIQHIDPTTKLQVWRTYFLNLNLQTNSTVQVVKQQFEGTFLTNTKYVVNTVPNQQHKDRTLLINVYLALVQGVLDGIGTISKDYRNLNREFLTTHILAKINLFLNSIYNSELFAKHSLEVWLESYDSLGEPRAIDFKDSITFKLTSTFYILKCRLNNVNSLESNRVLGSVAFSQGFLLQEGCYLLLTKNTPYFDFWKTAKEQNSILQKLNPNVQFQQLGASLSNDFFRNRLFVPLQKLSTSHFFIPLLTVKYFFHQKGIRFHNDKIGWHILPYSAVSQATMVNKISGQWVLLKIKTAILFENLQTNVIVVEFRGKAFDFVLKKVNDKTEPLPLNFLDVVPPLLSQNWYFSQQVLKRQVKQGAVIYQNQILQKQFLWSFIEAKQLMVLNQMKDIKLAAFRTIYQQKIQKHFQDITSQKPSLLIINGTYATNKLKLAQTLTKFGSNQRTYHIFHVPYENLYSRIQHSTFVQMLQEFINQNDPKSNSLFIAILPSWLNSADILPLLTERYHIRSIVSKINVNNFVTSKNGNLTENVLTFAVPGYSQTIVVDSNGQPQALISSVTKVLWHFNKEARLLRSSNSMLSTGQCSDILKDNTYNTEYQKFLRSKYGSLYKFDSLAQLSVNYIEFKYPIFDLPAIKSLTSTQGYLIDLQAIQQELLPKKLQAQNSKDELMTGLYKLEEAITIYRKKEKVPQIRCLKGVLQLDSKQKVEILWANRDFRERVVTETKNNLGLFVLSRNFDQLELKQFLLKLTYRKFILQNLKQPIKEQSLTQQDRTAISRQGRDKYLDNCEFYDGYFYRDIEGHILPAHPNLPRLIRQHLEEQNQAIETSNAQLQAQWQAYCRQFE